MIKRTWEEIYELLGLSVGDTVIITGDGANPLITLTPEGLRYSTGDNARAWFDELRCGKYELVPWEPKKGDTYWYNTFCSVLCNGKWFSKSKRWQEGCVENDDLLDVLNTLTGNRFRTRAEAEAHIPDIHEKYRKIREGKRFE